jgi:hypothetical protein
MDSCLGSAEGLLNRAGSVQRVPEQLGEQSEAYSLMVPLPGVGRTAV